MAAGRPGEGLQAPYVAPLPRHSPSKTHRQRGQSRRRLLGCAGGGPWWVAGLWLAGREGESVDSRGGGGPAGECSVARIAEEDSSASFMAPSATGRGSATWCNMTRAVVAAAPDGRGSAVSRNVVSGLQGEAGGPCEARLLPPACADPAQHWLDSRWRLSLPSRGLGSITCLHAPRFASREFLETVVRDAVTHTEHARRKAVTAFDVVNALKR